MIGKPFIFLLCVLEQYKRNGIGFVFSRLMKISHKMGFIDRESYIAQYLALTLLTIGITRTLGSDDLLAAFAAGTSLCILSLLPVK